ncbi:MULTISPECIES: class I SAM-dependent methyltransferase [unclassified Leptolyngbya]|uniref:class I SAM-dependent methyltransferase n=1 Tax=unclassified Leptolyngbya TaxID=2650499 RepID=UPI00168567C0|nr:MULTISPECIES: class I SAM-dependent methyltransferase [unclassified Leptolyngbya]MBD1910503.1 class I SAM-dependent methyltransferase [Leptolyngbya sp. FACHB-8]MBD2153670.1 class I SAM-dependent methyltransferase [Leptolyngbya sp. FACHB-16]
MTPDLLPLHQQNPLGRFSDRAQDYARYRPTYPPEAIATLLRGLGDPTTLIAADIGAGTGISARLLGDRGLTVWAIEPNAAMRAATEPHLQVAVRAATAEATGLPDASVHLVTCCQAFHWFKAEAALAEFHRILKSGGRVALLWNERKPIDRFTESYEAIICNASDRQIKVITDYKSSEALAHALQFKNYQTHYFDWLRPMTYDALIGLSLSASYVPKSGDAHEHMLHRLRYLFEQWAELDENGDRQIHMAYRTNVYLASK